MSAPTEVRDIVEVCRANQKNVLTDDEAREWGRAADEIERLRRETPGEELREIVAEEIHVARVGVANGHREYLDKTAREIGGMIASMVVDRAARLSTEREPQPEDTNWRGKVEKARRILSVARRTPQEMRQCVQELRRVLQVPSATVAAPTPEEAETPRGSEGGNESKTFGTSELTPRGYGGTVHYYDLDDEGGDPTDRSSSEEVPGDHRQDVAAGEAVDAVLGAHGSNPALQGRGSQSAGSSASPPDGETAKYDNRDPLHREIRHAVWAAGSVCAEDGAIVEDYVTEMAERIIGLRSPTGEVIEGWVSYDGPVDGGECWRLYDTDPPGPASRRVRVEFAAPVEEGRDDVS
ncbi:MAG: hypothetical protein AAF389_14780 [Gemmatimonadota bacterium]